MTRQTRTAQAVERALSASGIYEIVNLQNGKRYVGSATSIRTRWSVHRHLLKKGAHHAKHLQRAWDKYGAEVFEFRVLMLCPKENLIAEEQKFIDTLMPAYNSTRKAGKGGPPSDEARLRMSIRMRGNKNTLGHRHSAESLARISAAKIGNTATKGKSRNPLAVEKTAAAHRGRKRSAITCERISKAMRGKKRAPYSEETRRKLSEVNQGKGALSPEQVIEIRNARSDGRRVSEIHKTYPFLSRSMISMVSTGRRYAWIA